jgi:RNA polymerase sigma factor (TIGR02999 family)
VTPDEILPVVYTELRKLAGAKLAREKPGNSLNATALVHEAFLRLNGNQQFDSPAHFFAAAAEAMRRILVDQARARKAIKRGGDRERESLAMAEIAPPTPDDDILALNEVLDQFGGEYPDHAALVKLRYFAGMTADEAAAALEISPSTADRRWAFSRAWLKSTLQKSQAGENSRQ